MRIPLAGSEPVHPPGDTPLGGMGPEPVLVTLVLRSRTLPAEHPVAAKLAEIDRAPLPHRAPQLTDEELEESLAPDDRDLSRVLAFCRRHRLAVEEVSRPRHHVVVSMTAESAKRTFGVELERFEHAGVLYRSHRGELLLPEELHDAVVAVLGLDQAPASRWQGSAAKGAVDFTVPELARYYGFPAGATGRGRRIAILCFGGGFHRSDLEAYSRTVASIDPALVSWHGASDGAANDPMEYGALHRAMKAFNAGELAELPPREAEAAQITFETTMDIEIAAAAAPGAAIDVIFAPNTVAGYRDAVHAALGLLASYPHRPDVVSCSWANSEPAWTVPALEVLDRALRPAPHRGLTFCWASGDAGSYGAAKPAASAPQVASVGFPPSSPFALGCGGTTLRLTATGGIAGETAWNSDDSQSGPQATGGGVSGFAELPGYQAKAGVPALGELSPAPWIWKGRETGADSRGRGVPDVAANADFVGGYRILVGGLRSTGWGTSAAAPLWAGLIACLGERLGGPPGWLNRFLYTPAARATFRDVTEGNNDLSGGVVTRYDAGPGWDACTGLGAPDGEKLLQVLVELDSEDAGRGRLRTPRGPTARAPG